MEVLNHSPLMGEKLQYMGGVVGVSLCQAPTGVGNDSFGSIIKSLVEDCHQARLTSIGVEFKRPLKISIGKNRDHGTQMLQVIKLLLAPVIQGNCHLLLSHILTGHQFVQGLGYLHELGDELVVVPCKPKETLDLSDSGGGRPFCNRIHFVSIGHYSLG